MPDYMKELRRVTLYLSYNRVRKLVNGLNTLLQIGVRDSDIYSEILFQIQDQLDKYDAKEETT